VQEDQGQARDGNLFDISNAKPAPIAPQSLTREIPERSDYQGNCAHPARSRRGARRGARPQGGRRAFDRGLLPFGLPIRRTKQRPAG